MKKTKLIYIISGIDYALGFDWLEQHLDKTKLEVYFVFLNVKPPELHPLFLSRGGVSYFIQVRSKKDYPAAFYKLFRLIRSIKPDIVHCHLFDACLLGLSAAKLAGVKKRIYTRHHSTYHFDYHPRMVKIDQLINTMATGIAAITDNVADVLINREGVAPRKVFIVHHGFDLEKFVYPVEERVNLLKVKYNKGNKKPVIGVISRFTEWKGIQYIIPAFQELLSVYPDALLFLANAKGDMKVTLDAMLSELPDGSYQTIEFERDLFSLYQIFDIFVHVPVDAQAEAFGQTYVEALAAGVPSVFTLSGIAREFVVDGVNAVVVPYKDSHSIYKAIVKILTDENFKKSLRETGRKKVLENFPLEKMMNALYKMYEN